jgi:hypothetical protein
MLSGENTVFAAGLSRRRPARASALVAFTAVAVLAGARLAGPRLAGAALTAAADPAANASAARIASVVQTLRGVLIHRI